MQQDNAIAGLQDRSSAPHQLASLISLSENLKLLHTPLSPFSIHKKGGLAMNEWNSKQRDQLFQRKSVAVLKLMGQSSASIIPACLQNVPKAVLYQRKVYLNGFTTASEQHGDTTSRASWVKSETSPAPTPTHTQRAGREERGRWVGGMGRWRF